MQARLPVTQPLAASAEARADLGDVIQAVLSHTRFNLRQLQPAWLEACAARHASALGCRDLGEHVALLQRERSSAEELLSWALQAPPAPEESAEPAAAAGLRAGTRALLDTLTRDGSADTPLDVWVLVPEGAALLAHLREHLALAHPALPARPSLRLHGPAPLCALHNGAVPAATPLRPTAPLGDVRQTLHWLAQQLPEAGTHCAAPSADLIIASELFTCWRPDLQRQWLGRLAGALRSGGLLLLGRPKALWRAPRGLRAMHVDGLHWLQRSRAAGEAPTRGSRNSGSAPLPELPLAAPALEAACAATIAQPQPTPTTPALLAPPALAAIDSAPVHTALEPAANDARPVAAARAALAPELGDIGSLSFSATTRCLSLNAAMRRLLAWPEAAAPDWTTLLGRIAAPDRPALERVLLGSAHSGAAPWTLTVAVQAGADVSAGRHMLLRGEPAVDLAGQPLWHCLAQPATQSSVTPAAEATPGPTGGSIRPRLSVATSLPGAVARQELELLYQPQLDVASGRVRAVEALLRWHHPQLGQVEPRAFVPWAEECGLIHELGRWVLQQACRQARRWRDLGVLQVPMAVNVSAVQLQAADFVGQVEQALDAAGVPAQALELELTETTLLQESDVVRQNLAACRRLGVHIALDDFGTGQANLARLHRLPLDKLKLDPSFIRNLCIDRGAQAIVRSMVALGHQFGLDVVAEGVEQAQQLVLLGEARCDAYQGHHATPALTAEELTRRARADA